MADNFFEFITKIFVEERVNFYKQKWLRERSEAMTKLANEKREMPNKEEARNETHENCSGASN